MVILWFRQDLRLEDNLALNYAAASKKPIIPIYIFDSKTEPALGGASKWWLHHSLKSLDAQLKGRLNLFFGDPKEILVDLVSKYYNGRGADAELVSKSARDGRIIRDEVSTNFITEIVWNRCYDPYSIRRDMGIKEYFKSLALLQKDSNTRENVTRENVVTKSFNSSLLLEPQQTLKEDNSNYKVFTSFYKKHYALGYSSGDKIRIPVKKSDNLNFLKIDSLTIDELNLLPKIEWYKKFDRLWSIGEDAAHNALDYFVENKLRDYKNLRNRPDLDHSSRLSPHLHFGEISPNTVWHRVSAICARQGHDIDANCFLSELVWREFSYNLLYFFPDLPSKNLQKKFDNFPWESNLSSNYSPELFDKWKQGKTGYPIVDAGMRELWQTGFMHNRVRMITASFLVKHLLIDWRKGERWFWDCLVDADLANNSTSWQWVAGSGADAAPYFRIFNPILQGEKFDPEGSYTKKFVPELKNLPIKYLFSPWLAPKDLLNKLDIKIGRDYPEPIIDHNIARTRALSAYHEMNK